MSERTHRRAPSNERLLCPFKRVVVAWCVLAAVVIPVPASAQDSEQVQRGELPGVTWPRPYRKVGFWDYFTAGTFASLIVGARFVKPSSDGPSGGIWFDEGARNTLRIRSKRPRLLAEDVSDVTMGLLASYGMIIDPFIHAAYLRASPEVAKQLALINGEVIFVALGTQQMTAALVGRERPFVRRCGTATLSDDAGICSGADKNRSFFSAHTTIAFAMAASTCTHHHYLPLSGSGVTACATALGLAATTGVLRVASDNHYSTDVMTGAAVGSAVGFLIPFLHYVAGDSSSVSSSGNGSAQRTLSEFRVVPWGVSRRHFGLSVVGRLR